jgi:pimeloyl-ACP methyl ester carboxylesterase
VGSVNARNATATISIDQIHHGDRDNGACDNAQNPGVCVQPLFFNFIVPQAGRDNVRQSALDFVSLLRFVQTLEIPEGTSELDRDIPLSRENIMYMGHSQGGLNGPLLLAIEPLVTGAMLSGAGAGFPITLEQKRQPQDLNAFLAGILRLDDADPLDRWHPILALLQTYIEPADGVNYGEYWFHRPRAGARPKSIFMTVGLEDEYTTPDSTFALATSARVPLIEDVAVPVEGLELFGVPPEIPPYQGNVAGGSATAGLAQYPGEGHFLIFEVPSARQRYGRFMQSLAEEDPPRIF